MRKMDKKSKRVTIMIPLELDAKVRSKQAALIKGTNQSWSFSRVLADALAGKIKL